jgi:hypothetical protein
MLARARGESASEYSPPPSAASDLSCSALKVFDRRPTVKSRVERPDARVTSADGRIVLPVSAPSERSTTAAESRWAAAMTVRALSTPSYRCVPGAVAGGAASTEAMADESLVSGRRVSISRLNATTAIC